MLRSLRCFALSGICSFPSMALSESLGKIINRPDKAIVAYCIRNDGALVDRFGRNVKKGEVDGIRYALCYETWTSSHLTGFLHVYQRRPYGWYLCGVIVTQEPVYQVLHRSSKGLQISVSRNMDVFNIPFLYRD
jgi:hypothetical protein